MAVESDGEQVVEVVVETPRDGRNKFKFDPQTHQFRLGSVLPAGMSFPYDFGFIPGTQAEDGDPLDVLLLMDEPAFPGCRVDARLVGVIEAEQTEDDRMVRNDRLIAVAIAAHNYRDLRSLKDINANLLKEIERFFIAYNETRGKQFRVLGAHGPKRAMALLEQAKK